MASDDFLSRPASPFARVLSAPPRLGPGATVSVVAPSGPVERERLDRGLAFLDSLGLRPKLGASVHARAGYLAGSDDLRRQDLQQAIDDPETQAVFFARGGYGLTRIVDGLDMTPLCQRPKLVMGFSDVTALLLDIGRRADLATVHGPMVSSNLGKPSPHPRTVAAMVALVGPEPPPPSFIVDASWGIRIRAAGGTGRVTAPLVGGCLSLLQASLGTPFEISTRGAILFWEDVGEDLYRLDRMLTHLRLCGKLEGLAGMIVGMPVGITRERRQGEVADLTEFVTEWLGPVAFPVVTQFPCSHGEPCVSMPLHRLVTIDTEQGQVELPPL